MKVQKIFEGNQPPTLWNFAQPIKTSFFVAFIFRQLCNTQHTHLSLQLLNIHTQNLRNQALSLLLQTNDVLGHIFQ